MTTPRKLVAAQIAADWPSVDVLDYFHEPSEVRKPLAVVCRDEIAQGLSSTLDHNIVIQVYGVGGAPTAKTEDALDDVLDKVLVSLRRLDVLDFKKAERKILADVFHGWEITCNWSSQDYYKTTVTNERQ